MNLNVSLQHLKCKLLAIFKPCHESGHSPRSGQWPDLRDFSGHPAGMVWVPWRHRLGSRERWKWACAARWMDTGEQSLRESPETTSCRDSMALINMGYTYGYKSKQNLTLVCVCMYVCFSTQAHQRWRWSSALAQQQQTHGAPPHLTGIWTMCGNLHAPARSLSDESNWWSTERHKDTLL